MQYLLEAMANDAETAASLLNIKSRRIFFRTPHAGQRQAGAADCVAQS